MSDQLQDLPDPLVPTVGAPRTRFRTPRLIPEKAVFRPALALRSMPGSNGTNMGTMSYGEQLKHPNWQRRRLERLSVASFRCECCADGETTLHVHHKRYFKGRMAWEYADDELAVLCEPCHQDQHAHADELNVVLASLPVVGPFALEEAVPFLAGWARAAAGHRADLWERQPFLYALGAVAAELYWTLEPDELAALFKKLNGERPTAYHRNEGPTAEAIRSIAREGMPKEG